MKRTLALFLALPALAQQPVHLTFAEARARALQANPAVEAARRSLEEADARIKQARADYFPQLGMSGTAKAGLSGAVNALGPVGLPNSPFYRNFADALNVSFAPLDFGRREHRVGFERRRRQVVEAQLEAVQAEVSLETERAYYGVLRGRRLLDAARSFLRSQESTLRLAQALYDAQVRSRVDLELARSTNIKARLRVIEAEQQAQIAEANLARVLGSPQDTHYILDEPNLPAPDLPEISALIQKAFADRPEIRALQAEREAMVEKGRLARSLRKPQFLFAFSGGYARFTSVLARQLLAVGLGLSLPVFTGGRLEGLIDEAEAQVRILDSRDEELRQRVALEVRQAYLRLASARQTVPLVAEQSESARQALRLASERYREQLGSAVELNAAQALMSEADASEAAARYAAGVALAELRFATGQRE